MTRLLLPVLISSCLVMAQESNTKGGDDAKKLLQGVWVGHSMEVNGQAAPNEAVKHIRLTFRGDKLFMVGNFKDDREEECDYKIDAGKSPKHLDIIVVKGKKTILGIYDVKGDELKMCLRRDLGSDGRPSEFATKVDSQLVLMVLKKQKS